MSAQDEKYGIFRNKEAQDKARRVRKIESAKMFAEFKAATAIIRAIENYEETGNEGDLEIE